LTTASYYDPACSGVAATARSRRGGVTVISGFAVILLSVMGALTLVVDFRNVFHTLSTPPFHPAGSFTTSSVARSLATLLPGRLSAVAQRPEARIPSREVPVLGDSASPKRETSGEPNFAFLLGRVLDNLMHDYPRLFATEPNLAMYHPELEVRDDSSRLLKGLSQYRMVLQVLRAGPMAIGWRPEVTARYTVDTGMREVKVRWHVKLNPHHPSPAMVDGISVYKVGRDGLIYEHRLQFVTTSFIKNLMAVPAYNAFLDVRMCPGGRMGIQLRDTLHAWASNLLTDFVRVVRPVHESIATVASKVALLPAPGHRVAVQDANGQSLAVGQFSYNGGSGEGNGPSVWDMLSENLPPKLCVNKYDCEYKRGARCCDYLFVWACCFPNEEDWPPSGGIGIPVADPIPIEIPERDPWPRQQLSRLLGAPTVGAESRAAGQPVILVSQYHPSPLADLATFVESCPL